VRGRRYWSCTQWYLNDTQVATLSVTQQVPINITHYHTMNHRRFVSLLLVIPTEKHAAMALVHPPYHGPRMRIGALQRRDFMSAAPSMNNHELFGGNVVNIPPREEGLTPDRWACAKFASNTSLFPKRQSIRKSFFQTITPLLFVMLRKIALGSSPAWAATKSSAVAATSASFTLRKVASNLFQSIRHPTKETFRKLSLSIMAILLLLNVIEGIAASKRQQIDPTSEWGRYADKPAARGMALSLLLLKLLPFALLPDILEKTTNTKIQILLTPRTVTTLDRRVLYQRIRQLAY